MKKVNIVLLLSSILLSSCQGEFLKVIQNPGVPEKVSCLDHLNSTPSLPNGQYEINHDRDESTQMISVYCDMTGGGWTRIIKDNSTTVNDLALFGNTDEINSSFYSDPVMGIGWGEVNTTGGANADCRFAQKFVMERLWNYTEIKMEVSATFGVVSDPDNSAGYMYISNNFSNATSHIAAFNDGWLSEASGSNSVTVNGVVIRSQNASFADLIAYPFTIPTSGNKLQVCLGGEDPFAYNKRYINSMWIK